jgi:hypothetical protein
MTFDPGTPDRSPERPRSEPEIIPPDRDRDGGFSAVWMRVDERDGVRRVVIARPGLPSILLGLLIAGLIAAAILVVVAGAVLLWLPILVGGILLALLAGGVRHRWHRFKAWWARSIGG